MAGEKVGAGILLLQQIIPTELTSSFVGRINMAMSKEDVLKNVITWDNAGNLSQLFRT